MGGSPIPPLGLCLALVACSSGKVSAGEPAAGAGPSRVVAAPPAEEPAREASAPLDCPRDPAFTRSIPLPEASGATLVPAADGRPAHLLVVGDSGTRGAYVELDLATGQVLASGQLPLGAGVSDDLEGLSFADGLYHGLTSGGWMRHWQRTDGGGYELAGEAYPIAERRAEGTQFVCSTPRKGNCERNYEGLCLRAAAPADSCAGFAVSKADGTLYCLVREPTGRLRLDPERSIHVAAGQTLTGCHFAPDTDELWVGANLFGGNAVFRVTGWADPGAARSHYVGALGSGFPEALAVGPRRAIYRFSDTAGSPSFVDLFHCPVD